MSYASLGATSEQMSQMYSEMFRQQAQQRSDQELAFEAASPGITQKIASIEKQASAAGVQTRKLKKEIAQVQTDIAAYAQSVSLQDDLVRAQHRSLWILGGAVAVGGAILLLSGRR
jgi:peptidoglycan hydrolase CwlO-like protein